MNKQLLMALLIIASVISLALVIWFFVLRDDKPTTISPTISQPQPASIEPSRPNGQAQGTQNSQTSQPQVNPNDPTEIERQLQDKVRKTALTLATRLGTFSADDGFEAIRSSQTIATDEFSQRLITLRTNLQQQHPQGSHWFQELSAITATIDGASLPLTGKFNVKVRVQAQRRLPEGRDYMNVDLVLHLINNQWLVQDAQFTTLN